MSGGALDYLYSRLRAGAEHLEETTEDVYSRASDWMDDTLTSNEAVRQQARLGRVSELMEDLSELLKAIEWSWSGDAGFGEWEQEYERFSDKWLAEGDPPDPRLLRKGNPTEEKNRGR